MQPSDSTEDNEHKIPVVKLGRHYDWSRRIGSEIKNSYSWLEWYLFEMAAKKFDGLNKPIPYAQVQ